MGRSPSHASPDPACLFGLATSPTAALQLALDTPGLKEALADPTLPKDVHDLKAVLRALAPHNLTLAGVRSDVMLLSYLVNPTHTSHTLPDISARTTSRALVHQPTKDNPSDPKRLPEAAAAVARLAQALGTQLAEAGTFEHHIPKDEPTLGGAMTPEMIFNTPVTINPALASPLMDVYRTIDLPLVPVLLRMESAGVRIDPSSSARCPPASPSPSTTSPSRSTPSPARPSTSTPPSSSAKSSSPTWAYPSP